MYTGIAGASLALRSNSSFSYEKAELSFSLSSGLAFHGFSINPRFLFYGYCIRQSALISWAPSKSLLSSWAGSRCCRLCLRDWEARRRIGQSSDGSFSEMIGLLAEVTGCDRESFGFRRSRYELGSSEFGSSGRESKLGGGENGWSSGREGCRGVRRTESSTVCHCGSSSGWSGGELGNGERGQSVRKLRREAVIESGGGETRLSSRTRREDCRGVRRKGSNSVCHSKLDGDPGRGEFGQPVRKLKREVVIESGGGENGRSLRWEDRQGVRRNGSRSVCYSGTSSDWSGGSGSGQSNRARRVGGDFSQGNGGEDGDGGRVDVEEMEFREVWKYEDDARSKRSHTSKDDAGWDSTKESAFRERDDNLRALNSMEVAAEWEARNREERAAARLHSAYGVREEYDYDEQNVVGQRQSREESRRLVRTSEARGNDTRSTSSSISVVDARKVDRKESSTSAVKHRSEIDKRVVGRAEWEIGNGEEEADRLMGSAHEVMKDHSYEEQNVVGQRESTEGYQKFARRSAVRGNETRRASSSKNMIDARRANQEEGSMPAARWRSGVEQGVAGRAERRTEDREERGASSVGLTHGEREDYVDGEENVSRQWETREGSQKVLRISEVHEDDSDRVFVSKNMIDASKNSRESNSTSAVKQHTEIDRGVVERTESRRSSQNLKEISEVHGGNIQRASKSQRHFEEKRLKGREDRSTSVQNSVQMARGRRSQMEQNLVGRIELNEKYEDHADVSRASYTSDAANSVSSQNLLDSSLDDQGDHSALAVDVVHRARERQNENNAQFTRQASSRRDYERNAQKFEFSRSDNERASNSQEIYNTKIDDERVSHRYSSRRESEKDAEILEYSRSDVRGVTGYQERHNSRINDHGENSSTLLVQGRMERQRSSLTGESSESTKAQKVFTGSLGSSSSGFEYPHTQELDDQISRDEMQVVKDGALESARRLDESSSIYVGEFVNKLQQEMIATEELKSKRSSESHIEEMQPGTTQATSGIEPSVFDAAKRDKDGRYIQEGAGGSSSVSGMRGPSDEMWDVKGFTSQETSRIEEPEEDSSAAGVADTQTAATTSENAITQRSHRSLWTYIAGIIRLGFGHRSESDTSRLKSGAKSSSNESVSSETWFSGQEVDASDDNIDKKGKTVTPKESSPIRRPADQPHRTHSAPSQQRFEAPRVVNRIVMSEGATSASMSSFERGSVPKGASLVSGTKDGGQMEGEKRKQDFHSSIVRADQPSPLTDNTCSTTVGEDIVAIGNVQMPVSGHSQLEEELVSGKPPAVDQSEGNDEELKRRKLQRNKQVLRERFDEWEEAYRLECEQRKIDEFFMREALVEAQKAADAWEVPVGAVLVQNGKIIARGCNLVEELRDSTAHAEMICIRQASNLLRTWRLAGTTLYVTLEPCAMCAGAILQARIDTVVWGAPNKLLGADGSWVRLFPGDGGSNSLDPSNQMTGPVHPFHPKISIRRGVLATECSEAMQQFFQLRRKNKKPEPSPPAPSCLPISPHRAKFFTKIHDIFSIMFCL